MSKRFSKEELHRLRNKIPVALVIKRFTGDSS